jgi:hypothetical protein
MYVVRLAVQLFIIFANSYKLFAVTTFEFTGKFNPKY